MKILITLDFHDEVHTKDGVIHYKERNSDSGYYHEMRSANEDDLRRMLQMALTDVCGIATVHVDIRKR